MKVKLEIECEVEQLGDLVKLLGGSASITPKVVAERKLPEQLKLKSTDTDHDGKIDRWSTIHYEHYLPDGMNLSRYIEHCMDEYPDKEDLGNFICDSVSGYLKEKIPGLDLKQARKRVYASVHTQLWKLKKKPRTTSMDVRGMVAMTEVSKI